MTIHNAEENKFTCELCGKVWINLNKLNSFVSHVFSHNFLKGVKEEGSFNQTHEDSHRAASIRVQRLPQGIQHKLP